MTVFYEIATINNPIAEPFAVMRIDTEKVVGDEHGTGVEGVVVSTHWTREEAESAYAAGRTDDFQIAARAEVTFLKSLLPPDEQVP